MKRIFAVMTIFCLSAPSPSFAQGGYEGLIAPPSKTQQQQYQPPQTPKGGYGGVVSWDKKTDTYGQNAQPQADNLYDYIQDGGDPKARQKRLQAEAAEQQRARAEEAKTLRLQQEQERQAKAQAAIDKVNADNQQLLDNASRQADQWQQQSQQPYYGQ